MVESHPMRVAALVPSKLNSERVPSKNIRPLGGVPLINYCLRTLGGVAGVDDVVIYASEPKVMDFVEDKALCRWVERPEGLDAPTATAEDFIAGFLESVPCDVVVLLHATAPFLTSATVQACLNSVTSGQHESAFAAIAMQRFAWFEGSPLNYELGGETPRTQDLTPVVMEQSGLYVFTRALFESSRRRVAERPYIHLVDEMEGHDIDTPEEFQLAEMILAARN